MYNDDLVDYLQYECTFYPISLLSHCGMHRIKKRHALYQILDQSDGIKDFEQQTIFVFDSFLLHKVVLKKG